MKIHTKGAEELWVGALEKAKSLDVVFDNGDMLSFDGSTEITFAGKNMIFSSANKHTMVLGDQVNYIEVTVPESTTKKAGEQG